MAHRNDFELELRGMTIPASAWIIAGLGIVAAAMVLWFMPGPMSSGCAVGKSCFPVPHAPLYAALACISLAAAASTWFAGVSRASVVGWAACVAAISTLVLSAPWWWLSYGLGPGLFEGFYISMLLWLPAWVCGTGLALIATVFPRREVGSER
jgi:hypothetical protein